MASGAADGVWLWGAVDADAGAVEAGPEDSDGVVWAGGEVVEIIGALAALKDSEVVTKPGEWDGSGDTPFAFWCGVLCGAWGDGEGGEEVIVFVDRENFLAEVDGDAAGAGCGCGGWGVGGGVVVVVEGAGDIGDGDGGAGWGGVYVEAGV